MKKLLPGCNAVVCAVSMLTMCPSALGAIGAIHYDLTHSGGSDADIVVAYGAGAAIAVEVSFSTDPSGTSGSNRGAAGMNFRLDTGLPLADQVPMALNPFLTTPHNAEGSTSPGLGFASFNDPGAPTDLGGDPAKETIDSVGAFQGLVSDFDRITAMLPRHASMAEHVGTGLVGGFNETYPGPILMATGTVLVDAATPTGTYLMVLTSNAAKVWDTSMGNSLTQDVPGFGDALTIIVVPEPWTVGMLGLGVLAVVRKNRGR